MTQTGPPDRRLDGLPRPLRRIPLKEEFGELTRSRGIKDTESPLILAHLEYKYKSSWDLDALIEEEVARARALGEGSDLPPTRGWISIDARKFAKEMMLNLTPTTMRRRIGPMVALGWILERNDPLTPWVRTKQGRFNPVQVASDLWTLGFVLADWHFPEELRRFVYGDAENGVGKQGTKVQVASVKLQNRNGNVQVRGCTLQDRKQENDGSYTDGQILSSESNNQIDRSGGPGAPEGRDVFQGGEDARGQIDRPEPPQSDKNTADIRAEQLRRQVDQTDDSEVSNAAATLAVEIVREMRRHAGAIDAAKIAKLAQIHVAHGREHVLRRVVGRVAKTAQVRYPWRHLTYSLANEPEETELARRIQAQAEAARSGQDGQRNTTSDAARRREGYEWLFGDGPDKDPKNP